MIDYKLAKELKDAGFPQTRAQGAWWYDGRKNAFLHPNGYGEMEDLWVSRCVRIPTLSELIEACALEDFLLHTWSGNGGWIAADSYKYLDAEHFATGPSPEIAVARLWLALNKK